MKSTYDLDDNDALVHEIKCRRESGEEFEQLATGEAKQAFKQLSPEDLDRLKQLTDPNK